ncbi:MAG: hypothetical protein V1777_05125 [Candidatus Micrarchaeota archaeon]
MVQDSFSAAYSFLNDLGSRFWGHSSSLLFWTLFIVIFSILIFKFYRFIAKRDLFSHSTEWSLQSEVLHQRHGSFWGEIIMHGMFFPFLVFLWFAGFAFVLFFSAPDFSVMQVALVSATLVAAIRITAYYNEELSTTLAELMPYWLLGTVLVSTNVFSIETAANRLSTAGDLVPDLLAYFTFIILAEWIMRILAFFKHLFLGVSPPKKA